MKGLDEKDLKPEKILTMPKLQRALSFRNVFPVVLFSMIFVLAIRQSVSIDPDLWWHLKAGEQVVNNRAILYVDDYSFTKNGSEWVMHEWLSEILIYGIFRLSGMTGLVVVFSSLIVIALLIAYRRCAGRPYFAGLAILLAAASSSPLFGIRPQMITLLFASIYIALLSRFSENRDTRVLIWLPPMMLLWVNLHGGFALGLALIGLYLISAVLNGSFNLIRPLTISLLASTAVVPLNPNGFRMFSYPYETLSLTATAFIEEWASPDFHKLMFLPLAILLLSLMAVLALSPKRLQPGDLFLLLLTAFGALRSVRHIPIFVLIATPILANHLWSIITDRGWDRWFTGPEKPPASGKLLIHVVLFVVPLLLIGSRLWHFASHQKNYEAIRNPVTAVDFLKAQKLPGPIYNRYGWGGYLIYRLYPDYRVYIDGRADVYGDKLFAETMGVYEGNGSWREPLDRFGIKTVLIAPDAPLASILRSDPRWGKAYEDGEAVIFTR